MSQDSLQLLITTGRHLENLLADEINSLCADVQVKLAPGQVSFEGTLEQAYTLCLWSRLANRVLLKLAEGTADSVEQLYELSQSIPWYKHFDIHNTFAIDFNGTNRTFKNTQFGAQIVKDGIVDLFTELKEQRPSVDKRTPDIRIQCRIHRQFAGIYLDLSGQSLHIRHYREKAGRAPLKEYLAYVMLLRSGWINEQDKPLYDPMCGSGTIAIEAAQIKANIAPGAKRIRWGFTHWRQHDSAQWEQLKQAALTGEKSDCELSIYANDIDGRIINTAFQNAKLAGVDSLIEFTKSDGTSYVPPSSAGYLVSNPPFGERLSDTNSMLILFQSLGLHLKQHFKSWQCAFLTSNRSMLKQLKLIQNKEYNVMNGKLECQIITYILNEKNCEIRESKSGDNDEFANRLKKNLQKTQRWLKQQNTECYRIYDGDLPEYNVAIDRYGEWVVVQEYAAPKHIPEAKTQARLQHVIITLPKILDISPYKIVTKTRKKQKGTQQYEKLSQEGKRFVVQENGAKFWVNLTDYLDTGLFLDHRDTRQMIFNKSKGKSVLNLFAYTGSVSVFAALGNAKRVTTVDMSNTYLNWAKDNFILNKLDKNAFFIKADCISWIETCREKFDLIFVDPPSFSNSKSMEDSWDVQRDHEALLESVSQLLNENGEIIFSNNLRQFKLNEAKLSDLGLTATNITVDTIPEDFKRNSKIHHCWIIRHEQ